MAVWDHYQAGNWPLLFQQIFGGHLLDVLFFLGLTFTGFSSLIAHMELLSRVLVVDPIH